METTASQSVDHIGLVSAVESAPVVEHSERTIAAEAATPEHIITRQYTRLYQM